MGVDVTIMARSKPGNLDMASALKPMSVRARCVTTVAVNTRSYAILIAIKARLELDNPGSRAPIIRIVETALEQTAIRMGIDLPE